MDRLSTVAEAIGSTPKKKEKVRILAAYLCSRPVEEAALSAVFLSGRAFPAWEETTLQVGGALLVRVLLETSGKHEIQLEKAYRKTGDLGAAAYELLSTEPRAPKERSPQAGNTPGSPDAQQALPVDVLEVGRSLRTIAAARGPASKAVLLRKLLERATPLQAKYLIKIITGEWRIGLKESLVEEAIAAAFHALLEDVQRANMLLGDIGETLRLAASHDLGRARMRMLHPLGFMLASPVESTAEAFEFFSHAQVEDKYDGIRAQAHSSGRQVRLFSRTLDDVTQSFPELVEPLEAFPGIIFDGEVVAWDFQAAQALPFSALQQRLGRKKVTPSIVRSVPVAYVVFDLLYADGELLLDKPLSERGKALDRIFAEAAVPRDSAVHRAGVHVLDPQGRLAFEPAVMEDQESAGKGPTLVLRAPALRADSPQHLEDLFRQAQARGNEGLMIKDLNSSYTPGRRGRSWLKLKRELATLDVVVTSVEWGHGKRFGVLSDYTFAVRDPGGNPGSGPQTPSGEPLLNVGKAYSGLTDREIAEMTQWFVKHTLADHGYWREVEPRLVIEVAFNAVMRSDRHESGYALRFPRILRLRRDKAPDEIDTLERVQEIFGRQQLPKTA
jgi:DNA ligase-1